MNLAQHHREEGGIMTESVRCLPSSCVLVMNKRIQSQDAPGPT